eukprot:Selendium_serpulae@DN11237_c0_g1_i1.p1
MRGKPLLFTCIICLPIICLPIAAVQQISFKDEINHRRWLSQYGIPQEIPPVAWCSDRGMTVAVPTNSTHFQKRIQPGNKLWGWSGPDSGVDRNGKSHCKARVVERFFYLGNGKHLGAWLGSALYEGCHGEKVTFENTVCHLNVFRPPGPTNNVQVTCACPLNSKQKTDGSSGARSHGSICVPTARWESTTQSIHSKFVTNKKRKTGTSQSLRGLANKRAAAPNISLLLQETSGGSFIPVGATAGPKNEVNVPLRGTARYI